MKELFLKEFTYEYILLHDNLTSDEKLALGELVKDASEEQVKALLLCGEFKEKLEEGESEFVQELFEESGMGQLLSETEAVFSEVDVTKIGSALVKGGQVHPGKGIIAKLASKYASLRVPTKDVAGLKFSTDTGAWSSSYKQAVDAIQKASAAAKQPGVQAGAAVAAAVMATLVILLARKAYRAYLSKAARACITKTGPAKNECIRKFKIEAIKAEIAQLQQNKAACDYSKNPEKCKAKLDKRINKVKAKIQTTLMKKKPR